MNMLQKHKILYGMLAAVLLGIITYLVLHKVTVEKSVLIAIDQKTEEQRVLDEKIAAIELKLTQTRQEIESIDERVNQAAESMDERVNHIAAKQQQVCESAKEIRKSYVKERVRREIADEVIKNHLGAE